MSFGLYAIGFAILIGGLIYPGVPGAHARALDRRWRDRALRHWNSYGCKSNASERCGRIAVRRNLAFLRILQVFSTIREFTVA